MRSGFDIADIMDEIVQRAYGERTTAEDIISARRSVYLTLENWHALQYNTWRIRTKDFIAANGILNLPAGIDDILTATCVNEFSDSRTSETAMERISETEYANLTTKDIAGQPTTYMLRRTELPRMFLHPRGRTGRPEKIRVTYIGRPENYSPFEDGTDDLPARWLNALILSAALDLASKNPERSGLRLQILSANAGPAVGVALANDRQRNNFRMRIR
jgi:hypothetical protein